MTILSWLLTAALAVNPVPGPTHPTPAPTLPAITVMSIGDSLTYGADGSVGASYRAELSRLMNKTGQPHTWVVQAVGGTKCGHWPSRLDGLITTYHPQIIFLDCGTNDVPGDETEAAYRSLLATAQARGVLLVASLIGIPDMRSPTNTVRPWIIDWMHGTNQLILAALADYPNTPVADMQRVPANPEWLQADGIHLTARSEAAYAQLFYQAVQPWVAGWRTFADMGMGEMCGLSGAWITDPWPTPDVAYRVCRN